MPTGQRQKFTNEEVRIALIEQERIHINESLKDIKFIITQISNKIENIDHEFKLIKDEFKTIKSDSKSHFKWTMGFFLSILSSIVLKSLHF